MLDERHFTKLWLGSMSINCRILLRSERTKKCWARDTYFRLEKAVVKALPATHDLIREVELRNNATIPFCLLVVETQSHGLMASVADVEEVFWKKFAVHDGGGLSATHRAYSHNGALRVRNQT